MFLNPSAHSMLAASQGPDPLGSSTDLLDFEGVENGVQSIDAQVRLTGQPTQASDLRIHKLDGTGLYVDLIASRIHFDQQPATQFVLRDVTDRHEQAHRQDMLMRELDHRVKNNLAGSAGLV